MNKLFCILFINSLLVPLANAKSVSLADLAAGNDVSVIKKAPKIAALESEDPLQMPRKGYNAKTYRPNPGQLPDIRSPYNQGSFNQRSDMEKYKALHQVGRSGNP